MPIKWDEEDFEGHVVKELSPIWTLAILVAISCIVGIAVFCLAAWRFL